MTAFQKRKNLSFADIAVLALIFFGYATFGALTQYGQMQQTGELVPENFGFYDTAANYYSMVVELISLVVAWFYLRWRCFDFSTLDFSVNRYTLPLALLLIVCAGLFADFYQYIHAAIWPHHYPASEAIVEGGYAQAYNPFAQITLSLLLFALLNGFFEELFFMGLVFATPKKWLPYAIIFSLGVRFVFHVYQGLAGAATITTLGLVFLLFRRKITTLLPFMLAHAFFDVFGLSLYHLYG